MSYEQWLVLGTLVVAVVLFVIDRLRADIIALIVLVTIVLTGLLTPAEAFAGFASPAVVTVWAVFIISGALLRSGVADLLGDQILKVAGRDVLRLQLVVMLVVGGMSAFMNNIGAVAILMPAVVAISKKIELAPSKMLMPMAFAALLGGNMTLIGTPPNILATEILARSAGIEPFGFFDFFPLGFSSLVVGVLYMTYLGNRLLPERFSGSPIKGQTADQIVTEVRVRDRSPILGQTLPESELEQKYQLQVIQIRHMGQEIDPQSDYRLRAGDVLLLEGEPEKIVEAGKNEKLRIFRGWERAETDPKELTLAEITLAPHSRREGQTLKDMNFRNRYGLSVVSIQHDGDVHTTHLGDIPLQIGDDVMVEGPLDRIEVLHENPNFLILDTSPLELKKTEKIPVVLGILGVTLLAITMSLIDTATGMLVGAIAMVLSKVISMEDAYRSIDWQAVFLIAGLLPLGMAMENTGTAAYLAQRVVDVLGVYGPLAVLGGLFILTSLLTSFISNAATTVLMVPIAIAIAHSQGIDPRSLVMGVVLAASTSFMTPVGHQVNVIIMGPGNYRFIDFVRVGALLNLLILILALTILPLIWPF